MSDLRPCPKCSQPLAIVRRSRMDGKPVEIEECPACRGHWFDDGELRLAEDAADQDIAWTAFEIWRHPEKFRKLDRPMKCPRCSRALVGVEYGSTGVAIDVCPPCRGVWIDQGEFERIVHALEREIESKDATDLVRASLAEARALVTGGKPLATEWRDMRTVLRLLHQRFFAEHPTLASWVTGIPQIG